MVLSGSVHLTANSAEPNRFSTDSQAKHVQLKIVTGSDACKDHAIFRFDGSAGRGIRPRSL